MIRIIALALLILILPSGFVIASRLKRYLDLKLSMMEDQRYREMEREYVRSQEQNR